MFYEFIEIGTCDFDTEIQKATELVQGLSVEALQFYLDRLPNKKNVKKVCAAITHNKIADSIEIYYIPKTDKNIEIFKSKSWIFGCNSIAKPHPQHLSENVKPYVVSSRTRLLNVSELLNEYEVSGIGKLKIDTEGHDPVILAGFIEAFNQNQDLVPHTIEFETNSLSSSSDVNKTISALEKFGFRVVSRGLNAVLKR